MGPRSEGRIGPTGAARVSYRLVGLVTCVAIVVACTTYGEDTRVDRDLDASTGTGTESPTPTPPPPGTGTSPPPPPTGDSGPSGGACPACPSTAATCVAAGCTGQTPASCETPAGFSGSTLTATLCPGAPTTTVKSNGLCTGATLPAVSFTLPPGSWNFLVLDMAPFVFHFDDCASPGGCGRANGAVELPVPDGKTRLTIAPETAPTSCITFRVRLVPQ